MKRLKEDFSGDYRVLRVVLADSNPVEALHRIRTGQYSVRTFLDVLEMLDVRATLEEEEIKKAKRKRDEASNI